MSKHLQAPLLATAFDLVLTGWRRRWRSSRPQPHRRVLDVLELLLPMDKEETPSSWLTRAYRSGLLQYEEASLIYQSFLQQEVQYEEASLIYQSLLQQED